MVTYNVTLNDVQERALAKATQTYNVTNGTALTPAEFFAERSTGFLDQLVKHYRERMMNQLVEAFNQKTPAEQQAILAQLGVTIP